MEMEQLRTKLKLVIFRLSALRHASHLTDTVSKLQYVSNDIIKVQRDSLTIVLISACES